MSKIITQLRESGDPELIAHADGICDWLMGHVDPFALSPELRDDVMDHVDHIQVVS